MVNILIGVTGSVASLKLPILVSELKATDFKNSKAEIKIIATENSQKFFSHDDIPFDVPVLTDDEEWALWNGRGDPVLHIDLTKWADIFVISPLDANTLAKVANGICDNLLTCTVRAWPNTKPLSFCPAMNTQMWNHPITNVQVAKLVEWGYHLIPCVAKTLICGDTGIGAMAEVNTIVEKVKCLL